MSRTTDAWINHQESLQMREPKHPYPLSDDQQLIHRFMVEHGVINEDGSPTRNSLIPMKVNEFSKWG